MIVIISIALGLIVGTLFGERLAQYILILYYHGSISNENSFLSLYNSIDDERHYEMYVSTTDNPPSQYSEYLKLHQAAQSKAYSIYDKHISELKKFTVRLVSISVVIPIAIIALLSVITQESSQLALTSSVLFLSVYAMVIACFVLYTRVLKQNGREFHAILMVSLIINSERD